MSSKPIQDRIYRSRLTIRYRTNIDGVPVPQKLPLRLLVMGDLSGNGAVAGGERPPLPEAMRFENRSIISITRGTKIDRVMEGRNITFPIPEAKGRMAALANSARLDGKFATTAPYELSGQIVDVNDEGRCSVHGLVHYEASLYDNRQMTLAGPLEAMGTVAFQAATVAISRSATLAGTFAVHARGAGKLSAYRLEKDAEGAFSVHAVGPGSIWHDTQDPAGADKDKPWISGDVGGKLAGTIQPAPGRQRASFAIRGQSVEITFTKEVKYGLRLSADIPLVNDSPLVVDGGKATVAPQDGGKASFEVGDTAPTPIAISFLPGPLVGGNPSVRVKPGDDVTLTTADAPAKTFTGTPTGQLVAAASADGPQSFTGKLTVTAPSGDEHEVDVAVSLTIAGGVPAIPADAKVTPSGKVRHVVAVEGTFDVDVDDASVASSGGALSLAVACPVRVRKAAGGVLTGVATGALTGAAGSFAVGDQDTTGSLTIESGSERLVLAVKARPTIVVAREEWRIDDSQAPTYDLEGDVPVAVAGDIPVGHLLEIANGRIPVGKQGVYRAVFREGALLTLKSKPGGPAYAAMGTLTGTLTCSLKRAMTSSSQALATPDADLAGTFAHAAIDASCKLEGTLEIIVPRPHVSLTLYGRLSGQADAEMVSPDALNPEQVRADVFAVVNEGTKLRSSVSIDADGKVSVSADGPCEARRSILIDNLDAFSPDSISRNVPEIRRLKIVRGVLNELKSLINLMPPMRDAIQRLAKSARDVYPVLREKLRERYPALVIGDVAPEADAVPITPQQHDAGVVWFERTYPDHETALARAAEVLGAPDTGGHALVMVPTTADGAHARPGLVFHDQDIDHVLSDRARLLNGLASLIINDAAFYKSADVIDSIDALVARLDALGHAYIAFLLGNPDLRLLERNWRGIAELCGQVESDEVIIDLLHVAAEELRADLSDHASDIFTSTLFKRIYVDEYDRYGGKPFGAMIGLYYFDSSDADIACLTTLSEIANAAHCPFVSSVNPKFFGDDMESWDDLKYVGDIEAHLNLPKFGKWNVLRDSAEAPYLGLTLPGYLARKPWGAEQYPLGNRETHYDETERDVQKTYLWGHSAILFAKNLVRSFEQSEWCQYIRGVKGGGLVQGLTVHNIRRHDREEPQSPVEFDIADYRELQFAKGGLMPLVHCKGSSDAAFFSTQSLKKPRDFRSEIDTQNAYLVCNLSYTFSITRIAHYVKRMMRDYIGSTADGAYIQNILQLWLNDYITTTVNPDDLTLRYYPFKAVSVSVVPKPGPLGWYKAIISILPHIQFEGMDVELRLEAALGGK